MKRMRRMLVALAIMSLASSGPTAGQDATDGDDPNAPGPWKVSTTIGLNLTQSSYSRNWSGGDTGSIVWALNSDFGAERQFSETFNLNNTLQVAYGQTSQQVRDPNDPGPDPELLWDRPKKTTDLLQAETIGRFTLHRWIDPYFSVALQTQFRDESNPLGTINLNPIRLKESIGGAHVFEKTKKRELISRLGIGFRQTFATAFVSATPLTKESFVSNDGGIEWQTSIVRPVLDGKVTFKGNLLVFQPVFYSKSSELETFDARARLADPTRESVKDFWQATDVDAQAGFTAAITEYLQVILFMQWIYDKFDTKANIDNNLPLDEQVFEIDRNIRKKGQFQQTLSLGLTYRLF